MTMESMSTKDYWRDVVDRIVRTAFQFAGGTLVLDVATPEGQFAIDWKLYMLAVVFGAAVSLTTSLATTGIGPKGVVAVVKAKGN